MTTRFFSVEEADRTLPLVRRIVGDLVKDYKTWRTAVARYEWHAGLSESASDDLEAMRMEIERLAGEIEVYTAELDSIGCQCKDFENGLIDFYGRHEGREVLLCWKLGEPSVGHWHELDGGFAGRQPIGTLIASQGGN